MGKRKRGQPVNGWVCLDKPLGLGSTDAVTRVRRLFDAQKAGHAGTLDPLATGVLPIALGEATKTVPFAMDADKSYRFTVRWGEATATCDREGEVVARSDVRPESSAVAAMLADRFIGEIDQVPPAFSAVRVNGERAYDLARAGQEVDMPSRRIVIHTARLVETPDADHAVIEIDCGKGTYVRSLARDLALALGTVGCVAALRRTRVGRFTEADALPLASLGDLEYEALASKALLPVETALDDIPALAVTDEDAFRLAQGRSIVLLPRQVEALRDRLSPSRIVSAMRGDRLVALGELRAGRVEPVRVFNL